MAIKAGQILHDVHGFVIDRIQTAGVGNINIPEERVKELGNYETVATVRDIPDLSFDVESLDVSTEMEALITGVDPSSVIEGQEFDFLDSIPIDIISPFKSAQGQFDIIKGIVLPHLTLESATYRFGVRQNAVQQFTFRGDSIYYTPDSPFYEEFSGDGVEDEFTLTHTAIVYNEGGDTIYVLGVTVVFADGTTQRLFHGDDYTDTATVLTIVDPATTAPAGSTLRVTYAANASINYLQTVHETESVKPAAVRAKDIDVYVGTDDATPVFTRWTGVQGFEATRRVNLDNDEEFGNFHFVSQDYDTADVTGSITTRDRDVTELFRKIAEIANVPTNEVVGLHSSVGLPVELRINHPDTGDRVKTLYIPDARFTPPGVQGRVEQKTETTFNFASDGGTLLVYEGERP